MHDTLPLLKNALSTIHRTRLDAGSTSAGVAGRGCVRCHVNARPEPH
jgi:hypothetical protein